jgi:hypothetical protein
MGSAKIIYQRRKLNTAYPTTVDGYNLNRTRWKFRFCELKGKGSLSQALLACKEN